MRRSLIAVCAVSIAGMLAVACESDNALTLDDSTVQFWRPISEPNILLPLDKLQQKLEFDLSQCKCSVFPTTVPRDNAIQFQKDKQRLVQTSSTLKMDTKVQSCTHSTPLIVAECMRYRGWEPTTCSGRVPAAGGGSLCSSYILDNE